LCCLIRRLVFQPNVNNDNVDMLVNDHSSVLVVSIPVAFELKSLRARKLN
jgi:hypothetical protein